MLKNPGWRFIILMIAVTLIFGAVAWHQHWVSTGEWSGWIQAVGSIEAIVAAFALTHIQHWEDARKAREQAELERDALILELMPQLTELNAWIRKKCAEIERMKADKTGMSYGITYSSFAHFIPKALESPSTRLLLLGREAGIRAVQIRELLRLSNARAERNARESYVSQGPDREFSGALAQIFRTILSLELITQTLLDDISALHANLVPLDKNPEKIGESVST